MQVPLLDLKAHFDPIRAEIQSAVRDVIDRLASMNGGVFSPQNLIDGCLDLIGPLTVDEATRQELIDRVADRGDVDLRNHVPGNESELRVVEVLKLIASCREFQLA